MYIRHIIFTTYTIIVVDLVDLRHERLAPEAFDEHWGHQGRQCQRPSDSTYSTYSTSKSHGSHMALAIWFCLNFCRIYASMFQYFNIYFNQIMSSHVYATTATWRDLVGKEQWKMFQLHQISSLLPFSPLKGFPFRRHVTSHSNLKVVFQKFRIFCTSGLSLELLAAAWWRRSKLRFVDTKSVSLTPHLHTGHARTHTVRRVT